MGGPNELKFRGNFVGACKRFPESVSTIKSGVKEYFVQKQHVLPKMN